MIELKSGISEIGKFTRIQCFGLFLSEQHVQKPQRNPSAGFLVAPTCLRLKVALVNVSSAESTFCISEVIFSG